MGYFDEGAGAAAKGGMAAVNPWLAVGSAVADTIGGFMDNKDAQKQAREDRAMQMRMWLAEFQNRLGLQNDARAQYGAKVAGAQALAPLTDRAFSGIQTRLGMGPASLGQTRGRNATLQKAAASYQPGMNPTMNQYGKDLEGLRQRFLVPRSEAPPRMGPPVSGNRRVDEAMAKRYANDSAWADEVDRKRAQG